MEIRGRVHNGVVVLDGEQSLPEGTIVTVSDAVSAAELSPDSSDRAQFPLVQSDRPGSLDLVAERIAELWEEDDLAAFGGFDEADPQRCKTEDRRRKTENRG